MDRSMDPRMDAEGQRLLQRLPDWLPERARPAVLVTVWDAQGSAPRHVGARMLCRDGRLLAGTIGGGHLEEHALRDALLVQPQAAEVADVEATPPLATDSQEWADSAGNLARLVRYPLGAKLAQCCGGVVRLHFQAVDPARASQLADDVQLAERYGTVLETRFGDDVLQEWPQPLPVVLVFGAGHVAAALARVLQPLPWRVTVVDQRAEWADPYRFPPGTEVVCTEPLRLLAAWGWLGAAAQHSQAAQKLSALGRPVPPPPRPEATRALVVTHDHALDRELVQALLQVPEATNDPAADLAYVGMIGSRAKVHATRERLRRRGVGPERLARLVAPIGLRVGGALLGGKLPGEIAIGVAAQLLALQQGLADTVQPEAAVAEDEA